MNFSDKITLNNLNDLAETHPNRIPVRFECSKYEDKLKELKNKNCLIDKHNTIQNIKELLNSKLDNTTYLFLFAKDHEKNKLTILHDSESIQSVYDKYKNKNSTLLNLVYFGDFGKTIPVLLKRKEGESEQSKLIPLIDNSTIIVRNDETTIGDIMYVLRKRIKLKKEEALFSYLIDSKTKKYTLPCATDNIFTLYEKYKNNTNHLLEVYYMKENTFG